MTLLDDLAEDVLLSPAQLLAALAEHERRAAVLALAVRHVETAGLWAAEGAVSYASWLRDRGRMSAATASRWVRRGRTLDRFEPLAEGAVSGRLAEGQVDVLERLARPKYDELLSAQVSGLVDVIAPLSVADAHTVCAAWQAKADAVINEAEPPLEPIRDLSMGRDDGGSLLGRFVLPDDAATELEKAIRTASTWGGSDDDRSSGERSADALFDIAAFYNRNHDRAGTPRHRPHVGMSVDESTVREGAPVGVDDDTHFPHQAATTDTYLCDCVLHTILRDTYGTPVGFGRSRYIVPVRLFRQVAARDGGCRFPGCDRTVRYCDAHHIRYWRHHGTTEYDNLTLLCNRHHHLVHRQRLELKLLPNGELHVTWPDGRHRVSRPHHVSRPHRVSRADHPPPDPQPSSADPPRVAAVT